MLGASVTSMLLYLEQDTASGGLLEDALGRPFPADFHHMLIRKYTESETQAQRDCLSRGDTTSDECSFGCPVMPAAEGSPFEIELGPSAEDIAPHSRDWTSLTH